MRSIALLFVLVALGSVDQRACVLAQMEAAQGLAEVEPIGSDVCELRDALATPCSCESPCTCAVNEGACTASSDFDAPQLLDDDYTKCRCKHGCSSASCCGGRRCAGCRCGSGKPPRGIIGRLRWLAGGRHGGVSFRRGGPGVCGTFCCRCLHCWRHPPPGDMIGHLPYEAWRMYYYARPYQASHVQRDRAEFVHASRYEAQPYANDMFMELHRSFAIQTSHAESLEFADFAGRRGQEPFFERIESDIDYDGAQQRLPMDNLMPQPDVVFDAETTENDEALKPSEPATDEPTPTELNAKPSQGGFDDSDLSPAILDDPFE